MKILQTDNAEANLILFWKGLEKKKSWSLLNWHVSIFGQASIIIH